jgi:hypothetical protein
VQWEIFFLQHHSTTCRFENVTLPLLTDPCSGLDDLLTLDSVVPFRVNRLDDFFSSFAFSSLCLTILVRRGLRGASADEFGRSSDELAFDWCILSRLLTRWIRCFEASLLVPFSRFLLEVDFVDDKVADAVDSPLFEVVFFVRLAVDDDKDETFVVRGMLSIDDCDDAVSKTKTKIKIKSN